MSSFGKDLVDYFIEEKAPGVVFKEAVINKDKPELNTLAEKNINFEVELPASNGEKDGVKIPSTFITVMDSGGTEKDYAAVDEPRAIILCRGKVASEVSALAYGSKNFIVQRVKGLNVKYIEINGNKYIEFWNFEAVHPRGYEATSQLFRYAFEIRTNRTPKDKGFRG